MIPWWILIPVAFFSAFFGMLLFAIIIANGRDDG